MEGIIGDCGSILFFRVLRFGEFLVVEVCD
jgi:hypothetical protein